MPPDDAWLDLSGVGRSAHLLEAVQRCLAAIDRVHRFPPVAQPVPIVVDDTLQAAGRYIAEPGNERILIRTESHGLTTAILHELGHVLDHYAAGGSDKMLTDEPSMNLPMWWRAVTASRAYGRLRLTMLEHPLVLTKMRASYLLHPSELFARSYAQYVTVKSEDEVLADDLAVYPIMDSAAVILPWRWTDADFADIFDALDSFLEADGWLRQSR